MNSVSSLARASYLALDGLGKAIEQIEKSALEVASIRADRAISPPFSALVRLQNARVQAASTAAVLRIINSLYYQLAHLPRR